MIWGKTNETIKNKAQKLQNFAAKVVDGKFDHVTPILKELKWLNIKNQITFNVGVYIYKQLNEQDCILQLPTVNTITQSTTRQNKNLYIPRVKLDTAARSLSVLGPKIWNNIPLNVKEASNIHSFKTKLKEILLN